MMTFKAKSAIFRTNLGESRCLFNLKKTVQSLSLLFLPMCVVYCIFHPSSSLFLSRMFHECLSIVKSMNTHGKEKKLIDRTHTRA